MKSFLAKLSIYTAVVATGVATVGFTVHYAGDLSLRQAANTDVAPTAIATESRAVETPARTGDVFETLTVGSMIQTRDGNDFFSSLFGKRQSNSATGSSFWFDAPKQVKKQPSTRYRTMCVRSCDGAYFPISFSSSRGSFRRDERSCQSRCGTDAKLYVVRKNDDVSEMKSIRGKRYTDLPTAFLFRTTYNPSCRCKPHAWEPTAKARHQTYTKLEALQEKRMKRRHKRKAKRKLLKRLARIDAEADRLTFTDRQQVLASTDGSSRAARLAQLTKIIEKAEKSAGTEPNRVTKPKTTNRELLIARSVKWPSHLARQSLAVAVPTTLEPSIAVTEIRLDPKTAAAEIAKLEREAKRENRALKKRRRVQSSAMALGIRPKLNITPEPKAAAPTRKTRAKVRKQRKPKVVRVRAKRKAAWKQRVFDSNR